MEETLTTASFLEALPDFKPRERTFLEIIKVAHRETIMANLIAYYLNPQEDHGMGTLFLKSLLQCYFEKCGLAYPTFNLDLEQARVKTEEPTGKADNNSRIDILIHTPRFVLVVEFKINHILDNPLADYKNFVDKRFSSIPEENRYLMVLAPKRQECVGKAAAYKGKEYVQVMLSRFIEQSEQNLKAAGLELTQKDPHHHYLLDFILTIKNRRYRMELIESYQKLAQDNETHEKLKAAFRGLQEVKAELDKQMETLRRQLKGYKTLKSSETKLYSVIQKSNGYTSVKVRLTLQGWTVEKWNGKTKTPSEPLGLKVDMATLMQKIREAEGTAAPAQELPTPGAN